MDSFKKILNKVRHIVAREMVGRRKGEEGEKIGRKEKVRNIYIYD
jgi:hypothetical protein